MATKKTKLPTGFWWKRKTIYYRIWHHEKEYGPYCAHTSNIKEAQRHKAERSAEIVRGEKLDTERGVRIDDLFDDYVEHLKRKERDGGAYAAHTKDTPSYKASSRIDKNLRPFFGNLKPEPDSLIPQLLTRYKDMRRKQASVSTVNTEFRLLRAALRRGVKNKKVNPLHVPDFSSVINEKAEKAAARTGLITPEQYDLIMGALADHLKPVFMAVYFSGVRQKEIKFVRRNQVNFETHMIDLLAGETKDGDLRVVPMDDQTEPIMKAWEAKTAQEYPKCEWFFHYNGEQIGSWVTAWNAALRRVGLRVKVLNPDGTPKMKTATSGKRVQVWKNLVRFHDTRRTNITSMDLIGLSEKDNMRVSGHKTVPQNRREAAQADHPAALPMAGLGGRYLHYYFSREFIWNEALGLSSGGTPTSRNRLKEDRLLSMCVPLPPLEEQMRIVERVETLKSRVDEAVVLNERSVGLSEVLFYSEAKRIRKELLSKGPSRPMSEITKVCSGGTPDRSNPAFWQNGTIPWVKTGELCDGEISSTEEKITHEAMNNSSAKLFPPETVLIAMYGQGQTRGRTALLKVAATTNQACAAMLPQPSVFVSKYLQYWLRGLYHEMRIETRAGAQPNWNAGMIGRIPFVTPSLADQRKIVEHLDAVEQNVSRLRKRQDETTAELRALMPSVLNDAFSGNF